MDEAASSPTDESEARGAGPPAHDDRREGRKSRRPAAASRWRAAPFHTVLIAAFPILSLYSHNVAEVALQEIWRPLGLSLAGSLAVWALFALLTRRLRTAAIAASALSLLFFSYGHLASLLPDNLRNAAAPLSV